jgi:hypothetical protein
MRKKRIACVWGGERVPETQEKKIVLGTTPLFTHTHTLTHISTHIPSVRVCVGGRGSRACSILETND